MFANPAFSITLIICASAFLGLSNAQLRWNVSPNPSMLVGLNLTVQAILASRANESENTTELWDLMPKPVRVLLTNQTGLPDNWNLTVAALINSYLRLSWDEIPKDVQARLVAQKNSTVSMLSISFLKWNLVNATDFRSNLTLENLVTNLGYNLLVKACTILDQVNYNMHVDFMKLSRLLKLIPEYYTNYNVRPGMGFDRFLKDVPLFTRPVTNHLDVNRLFTFINDPSLFKGFGQDSRLLFGSLFGLLDTLVYVPQDFNYWV